MRFHNLRKDELGLLLWSIELAGDGYQNIGGAKPFGYGSVKIICDSLMIYDNKKAYNCEEFCFSPFTEQIQEKEEYKNCYRQKINTWLESVGKNVDFEQIPQIGDFLAIKNNIVRNELVRYMQLDHNGEKEYQNRVRDNKALPSVQEVLKKQGSNS